LSRLIGLSAGTSAPRGTGNRAAVLIVGVGNPYRADDAAGLHAARRLRCLCPPSVTILEHDGEPADLLLAWQDVDLVILIDAVTADEPPGTVIRVDVGVDPLPPDVVHASTHFLGPGAAIELAKALDRLPPRLVVYGIVGADFGWGETLSPEVEAAMTGLVERVLAEIR
jgi:hydrogenase maturation protease